MPNPTKSHLVRTSKNDSPGDDVTHPKLSSELKPKPKTHLPAHVLAELSQIWSRNPRLPSVASRKAWAGLRGVDCNRINAWFLRKKSTAKKRRTLIAGEYDLCLDPPPPPPTRVSVTPIPQMKIETKKKRKRNTNTAAKNELLSPSPSPSKRPRIKLEQSDSDDDTIWTPSSDAIVGDFNPQLSPSSPNSSVFDSSLYGTSKCAYIPISDGSSDIPTHGIESPLPFSSPAPSDIASPSQKAFDQYDRSTDATPETLQSASEVSPALSLFLATSLAPRPSSSSNSQSKNQPLSESEDNAQTENRIQAHLPLTFTAGQEKDVCNQGPVTSTGFTCALCRVSGIVSAFKRPASHVHSILH